MKKILSFLLIIFGSFALISCGGSDEKESETIVPPTVETEVPPTDGPTVVPPTEVPTVIPPTDGPTVVPPSEPTPLPPAPTLAAGYCDQGYEILPGESTDAFIVNKYKKALQWEGAMLDVSGYTSVYSSFTVKFTSTNVTNFSIELIVFGGEPDWAENVNVFKTTLEDGMHEFTIDFTTTQPISTTNWNYVSGYYIKDYQIAAVKFVMDTGSAQELVQVDSSCVIHEIAFNPVIIDTPSYEDDEYVPSNTSLSFSDENANKVITEPTFDIEKYKGNAASNIKPYEIFASGMCLQRDAINRIWGTSTNTNYIAAEFKGKVYYGTVNGSSWEIYLPKMNAGGPYTLTLISEAGRVTLTNIYVGEVFLLSGQSNMEWQPQHAGDVLKDLYSSPECINDEIRMYHVGWNTPTSPSTAALRYSQWVGANQTTIPNFTAVGYIFGKQMQEELGCPVGLIANPVGGSSIEFWLSDVNYNKVQETYTTYTDGTTIMTPSLGYNGMLYPLTGINVRGVVWYQGESNAFGTQQNYDVALEIFMKQCREMFNNEQLSFTICELARYQGNPYAYSIINERINYVADKDPYTVVARNLDLGEWFDIHPKDKHEIGRRAAYETLRTFFNVEKEAPVDVTGYKFNADGTVTITLSRNASLVNGTNGFEVYVNGSYTYNCNVSINGNTITVSASGTITKVRYGYTCKMTTEIQNDVSKMVTVYDENGFPLDLFLITK